MADEVLMKAGLKKVGQRIYNYIDTRVALPINLMDYEAYSALSDEERELDILYIVTNAPVLEKTGSSIPAKTIVSIAGTEDDVPDGWVICDGQNGTPDLRGRFVLGSDGTGEGAQYQVNTTGGSDCIQVSIEDVNGVAVTSDHSGGSLFSGGENAVIPVENETESYGISTQAESDEDDNAPVVIPHMPPYYALLYIMKLDEEVEEISKTGTVLYYKDQPVVATSSMQNGVSMEEVNNAINTAITGAIQEVYYGTGSSSEASI